MKERSGEADERLFLKVRITQQVKFDMLEI